MLKLILFAFFLISLTACTIALSPEEILVADEEFRRTGFQSLEIQNTELLLEGATVQHEWLASESGQIALTWAAQSESAQAKRLVVFCMGNTTDRQSDGVDYLNGVLPFGDAVIFDYPGYGDSAGSISLDAFDVALAAVAERVKREPYEEVLVWGHSMGGILCPRLAKTLGDRTDGIVLEATFAGPDSIARYAIPWYLKPFIRLRIDERFLSYNTIETLGNFEGPILVLAANKDKELPIVGPRDLYDRLKAAGLDVSKLEFKDAGHYDIAEQSDYITRVGAVLAK